MILRQLEQQDYMCCQIIREILIDALNINELEQCKKIKTDETSLSPNSLLNNSNSNNLYVYAQLTVLLSFSVSSLIPVGFCAIFSIPTKVWYSYT